MGMSAVCDCSIPDHTHYLLFEYQFIALFGFKDRVWFELCHFLVTLFLVTFVQSSTRDLVTKFLFHYMNQQKVVNHCNRLNGNLIFPNSKIFSALIMVCKLTSCAKQAWCLLASWLISIALCLGDQSICFTDFDDKGPSIGVNLRGHQTLNIPSCDPPPKSV